MSTVLQPGINGRQSWKCGISTGLVLVGHPMKNIHVKSKLQGQWKCPHCYTNHLTDTSQIKEQKVAAQSLN